MQNISKDNANRLKNEIGDAMHETKRDVTAMAHDAGQRVRKMFDSASEEITHAGEKVSAQIHDKPVQSSLIALAAGFVLGMLIRR